MQYLSSPKILSQLILILNLQILPIMSPNLQYPWKVQLQKTIYSPPPWWNSSCSKAVKSRSILFRAFGHSGSISDFLNYCNVCSHTTRLLQYKKPKIWKVFFSNFNPSYFLLYLWTTAKRFKNYVNLTLRPNNNDWFMLFALKLHLAIFLLNPNPILYIFLRILLFVSLLIISIWPNYILPSYHVNL